MLKQNMEEEEESVAKTEDIIHIEKLTNEDTLS